MDIMTKTRTNHFPRWLVFLCA